MHYKIAAAREVQCGVHSCSVNYGCMNGLYIHLAYVINVLLSFIMEFSSPRWQTNLKFNNAVWYVTTLMLFNRLNLNGQQVSPHCEPITTVN